MRADPIRTSIPQLAPRSSRAGPRVTVVMPTWRRAHQIGESIRSLLEGTWSDFELLVQDDGDGTDGTEEAVHAASARDSRVHYRRNPASLRMPGNLNAGIAESRGDCVVVCHDHDVYKPHYLIKMVEALERHPSALFVHCAIDVISQNGRHVASHIGNWPELTPGRSWLQFMLRSFACPVCALSMVRRSAHERYGLYDPAWGFIADVEMWMRLARYGDVAYVNEPLVRVREREADHFATRNQVRILRTASKIHREYVQHIYAGWTSFTKRELVTLRFAREVARSWTSAKARELFPSRMRVAGESKFREVT